MSKKRGQHDEHQLELQFHAVAVSPVPSVPEKPAPTAPGVIRIQPYRQRSGDRRFRQRVKRLRGSRCESCGQNLPADNLHVHHILLTSMYPQYARDEGNVLVLCSTCHALVTAGEQQGASVRAHFYSMLPATVRALHCTFLEKTGINSPALISAFRHGNPSFWNGLAIRDLIR